MLGIAILFSIRRPFRSPLSAVLAAPHPLLPVDNDMRYRRPEGPRVLRGFRKAEGHPTESRWEGYSFREDAYELR